MKRDADDREQLLVEALQAMKMLFFAQSDESGLGKVFAMKECKRVARKADALIGKEWRTYQPEEEVEKDEF